jgi:DNA segregation ATPase FtsK/SpoIIIE-like protein
MRMMSGKQALFVSVLPEERSNQCQDRIDEWYPTFRKVGRALDSAYKVLEVNMPGRTAQAIGEVFGKMKKQDARKYACGIVGLYDKSGSSLNILTANYSDPVSYLDFLSSAQDGIMDLRRAGEKAMKFGASSSSLSSDDEGDNKHAACDWLAKPRREGDAKMRLAVFEPVDEDVFNFIATVIGEKNTALFARTSLFGCEVTLGQPVRESYGITLIADIDESDDEFNEDAEIKVMPIFADNNAGSSPKLGKEDVLDFLDKVILANATSAFREMVDTSVDANCANDIWELLNNLNDQFYEEVVQKKQQRQAQGEGAEGEEDEDEDEHFTPEIAWDTIREPMLKALDAHGKNDKNLQPTQWMCGLAGSIAAFAEAKSELASANSFLGELMTLRKESIQLRTRNAVLERELAEMETRMPAGGANSGAMGLPKAKRRGFGTAPTEKETPTPTPSYDTEERSQRQRQEEEEAARRKAEEAAAAAAAREEEERQRQEQEAAEAQRRREEEEEAARRKDEEAAAAAAAAREEEERQRQEQEAAEAQRRREEEEEAARRKAEEAAAAAAAAREEEERQRQEQEAAEAEVLRMEQEAEVEPNIPPSPAEERDPNLAFWSSHVSQGRTYYYNSQTQESTYEKPAGFQEPEKEKNEMPHVEL